MPRRRRPTQRLSRPSRRGGFDESIRLRAPALAKITRPRATHALPRTRLFRLLDQGRRQPVTWVTGPPGAGKTTLVASYLEVRRLPALWYRLDESDSDVASFFACMRRAAASAAPRRRKPLPLLTPEYLPGLAMFAHRYFQDLFGRLARPFVIVIDDYQDVPADSPLHGVLAEGLQRLPDGVRVIVLSRSGPPAGLARLRASGAIRILGWDQLRLTAVESSAMVRRRSRSRVSPETLCRLREITEGWAAGLVLLIEQLNTESWASPAPDHFAPDAVFDYFADQFLERVDHETQRVLAQSALLPTPTARMVERLTASPRAGRILADLARRGYFVTQQTQPAPGYRYHPLFRRFLLSRLPGLFPSPSLDALRRRAAELLEGAGQVEEAVALLRESGDWKGVARAITASAPVLLAQGRSRTLEAWLRSVPTETLQDLPWLRYWLAASRLPLDAAESRRHFERAFAQFTNQRDQVGTLLAWAGTVDAVLCEWADLSQLDPWIAWLDAAIHEGLSLPSAEIEARVTLSMFLALIFRQPEHPEMHVWEARALTLSRTTLDASVRIQVCFNLALYYIWLGQFPKAEVALARLRESARMPQASPLSRLTGKVIDAVYYWKVAAAPALCLTAVAEGLDLARTTGVHILDGHLAAQGAYGALTSGDLATATRFLEQVASALSGTRLFDVPRYHYLAAWGAMLGGDRPRAVAEIETSLKLAEEMGIPFAAALCRHALASLCHERGERALADEHLARARQIGRAMKSLDLEHLCLLAEAEFAFERGEEPRGLVALRDAMALGRAQNFLVQSWWRPAIMARLCARALEADIEVEYVRRLIRAHGLSPGPRAMALESWPWPVRILTLGRFEVQVDERTLAFAGKAQRRPLELLKALIAFGGEGAREARLEEALWPEADGDAAHHALAMTLHRLRRLLGHERAVLRQDGRLWLDPHVCWVDAQALQSLLGQAERIRNEPQARIPLVERALALYQGPFLAGDEPRPWTVSLRDRLRARVLRQLAEIGGHWEQAAAWSRAVTCFERALELEDCAEGFYRRLMTGYQRLGRRAEALEVYERCRRTLKARLGVEPSSETEAIHRALRAAGRSAI